MSVEVIIIAIITVLVGLLTYLIMWVKSKHPTVWVVGVMAVSCVEIACKIYGLEKWGENKKQAVTHALKSFNDKFNLKLTDAQIDHIIETIVAKMNELLSLLKLEEAKEETADEDE